MSATPDPKPTYATLRPSTDGGQAAGTAAGPAVAPAEGADPSYWRKEAQKLDAMLDTLWAGFLDAPTNGLPTQYADYVSAYTGATRLKLLLMGYQAIPGRGYRLAPHPPTRQKT